ncbi:hypothetical protein JRQ81_002761 [Phrynocephalus forsythii]|uniref:G-protein coupled receptors family 1 profile domain-containing protein n=1 Tax=Phrynocephalus forsythii TaxID=171643 RepID=A0A9Q0XIK5_9SAUR|nr:hypothetical protein JRQ81_002761 [Phrynocephalus forsythii]
MELPPNGSSNQSDPGRASLPYSPLTTALILMAVLTMALVTLIGNILVVLAVYTSRALRAPQNLFLVSLAAADILVATLIIPFSLANEIMDYWCFGDLWCRLYLSLDVLFCTASIMHLCAISLDRYWAVTRAARYNLKRSPGRIKGMIGAVWVIAAFVSLPPLFKATHQEQVCLLHDDTWYVLASCTASFYAPCLIMVAVYCRIYHVAKHRNSVVLTPGVCPAPTLCPQPPPGARLADRRQRRRSRDMSVSTNRLMQARERRFTFVLAFIIGAFVLCWFPFFFTYSLESVLGEDCCISKPLFKFFFWIGYCNSSFNPIIYTAFNRDFRRAFQHLLSKAGPLVCRK